MSERERFSWVWVWALALSYGPYFAALAVLRPPPGPHSLVQFEMLAVAALVPAVVIGIAALVIRRGRLPGERPMRDERDRAIEQRSSSAAYYVMIAGMIVVGCMMPFSAAGWDLVHPAILTIVIAELVRHILILHGYRKGWRG